MLIGEHETTQPATLAGSDRKLKDEFNVNPACGEVSSSETSM